MGATALRTTGIRKRYRLGQHGGAFRYGALRDTIYERFKHPFGRRAAPPPHIWALDGVDLEAKQGEGLAQLFGRVGSLLEVGTGFHPELTGRENIFLNGAILGMRRAEIRRKFDEFVVFPGEAGF